MNTLLVMIGGAVGAAARYHLGRLIGQGTPFPLGTLAVNVIGGLLMGLLIARGPDDSVRLLVGAGLLGGFTTFSAFSLETVSMLQAGAVPLAIIYVAASVIGACLALWCGLMMGRLV